MAAGVHPNHFLLSHLIEGSLIMLVQFAEYVIYSLFFLSTELTMSSRMLLALLLIFAGTTGVTFGLFISIVTKTVMSSLIVSQSFIYPTSFISGE